jgi:hypothetical protein
MHDTPHPAPSSVMKAPGSRTRLLFSRHLNSRQGGGGAQLCMLANCNAAASITKQLTW